jgi:hypothetical protein
VVLGRNVLGHQDKAPETLSLGPVAVLALVAGGVDLDCVHLLLLLLLIRRPFSESDMIEEKSDKVCEWLRAIGERQSVRMAPRHRFRRYRKPSATG